VHNANKSEGSLYQYKWSHAMAIKDRCMGKDMLMHDHYGRSSGRHKDIW
jgi:hypothetical protein